MQVPQVSIYTITAFNTDAGDGSSGNQTKDDARTGSITYTFNDNLLDGNTTSETTTITSNQVNAKSIVIANCSIKAEVFVHTVINGSFAFQIINRSGLQINNDSTCVINYAIL